MPQLIAAGLTAAGVSATVATVIGYVSYTALTVAAMRALTPKIGSAGAAERGQLVNGRSAIAPMEYVYGTVRKGGTITYMEATGDDNQYLHMIVSLVGHEVQAIGDIYVNDEVVSLDGGGFVTSSPWNSKIRVKKYLGTSTQTADPDLLSESNQIDSNFRGRGVAYLYIRLEYDQDVFASGIPLFTALVQGKKVYDPRSTSTAYSNNAALCVLDYMTDATIGFGDADASMDTVNFSSAANVCDENVALSGGGTEKRYVLNGIISADQTYETVIQTMLGACGGSLWWGGGSWKLRPGYYSASVKTFSLDDLRSPISSQTRNQMRDQFNIVRGTFNDSQQRYISTEYPEIKSATFITEDGGYESPLDLELPMTTTASAAQRLAKQTLFRSREQITVTADFGISALTVQVGDTIALTVEKYGWSAKEFEVTSWSFGFGGEGDLRVSMSMRETSADAYAWDGEESAITQNNTSLPTFSVVAAPTGLTLEAIATINDDGITIPGIKATWTPSIDRFVQYYEIQYKRLGGEEDYGSIAVAQDATEEWGSITVSADEFDDYGLTNEDILTPDVDYASVLGTTNSYTIQPVLNNYDYEIRVRAINSIGVRSPFVSAAVASQGDTTPPGTPSSLAAYAGLNNIEIRWTNPADQDLSYVEVWENTANNISTATMVGTINGTNFVRGNLANNVTRFYWVRAVDYSLNRSDFTASVSATTLLISPDYFNDAVNDLFTEAGAFGVEPVSSLPASGGFDGQLVLLLPDITIYRWDADTSSWSTDIYTASSVEAGSITYASFAAGIEPVGVVSTLPTVSGYTGPQVVVLTTDGKLYRLVSGQWTAAVNTNDITGTIGSNLFSNDLRPIEVVAALPSTGLYQGRVVLLTGDSKLYRYTGSAWTAAVPATDLTGQVSGTQIADAAITATKLGAAAVTTAKMANASVTGDILAASSVSETKIANGSISTPKLIAGSVTTSIIAASAITSDLLAVNSVTAGAIQAGSITSTKLATGSVTADAIAANSISATSIQSSAITSDKLATNSVTANSIQAGAISAAKLAVGSVTATAIASDAITADAIAANSISSDALQANSVVAGKVAAGAINTDQLVANAVVSSVIASDQIEARHIKTDQITSDKILAGSIITSKIAAGAVTAAEIAASAVTADKISVTDLSAISAILGDVTIENTLQLEAGGAGFIGGRTSNSAYNEDGFYIARTQKIGGEKGFEVSHTSVRNDRIEGVIHKDDGGLQIYNPTFFYGGSATGGVSTITTATSINAGETATVTVTAYGGGGAGGYGRNDGYGTGYAQAGGTTTVQIRAGSPSGTIISTVSASGGAGGLNADGNGINGGAGGSSNFGAGGAAVGPQVAANNAPVTHYSAGGGGAGGDDSSIFDPSGGGGSGGHAGQYVTQTVDCSAFPGQDIHLVVTQLGAGGIGSGGDRPGGNGANGAVTYSSILGGTTQVTLPQMIGRTFSGLNTSSLDTPSANVSVPSPGFYMISFNVQMTVPGDEESPGFVVWAYQYAINGSGAFSTIYSERATHVSATNVTENRLVDLSIATSVQTRIIRTSWNTSPSSVSTSARLIGPFI